MVKFVAGTEGGRTILGLIITQENLKRLMASEPIHLNMEEMDRKDLTINEVVIAYFATEQEAARYFIDNGLVKPENVKVQEKPTKQ